MAKKGTAAVRYVAGGGSGCDLVISGGASIDYPPHTHVSTCTVVLVRGGRVVLRCGGRARTLREGEGAVVPPHRLHSLRATAPYEMISICLDRRLFRDGAGRAAERGVAGVLADARKFGYLRRDECARIAKLLREWTDGAADPGDAIARLKDELISSPERDATLAEMAAGAFVCERHLEREFKRRYGLPPRRFQIQNRLRKVRRELGKTGSLTRAALLAGFYDQSHFIRYFKRLHGVTPRQYLQACERFEPR